MKFELKKQVWNSITNHLMCNLHSKSILNIQLEIRSFLNFPGFGIYVTNKKALFPISGVQFIAFVVYQRPKDDQIEDTLCKALYLYVDRVSALEELSFGEDNWHIKSREERFRVMCTYVCL